MFVQILVVGLISFSVVSAEGPPITKCKLDDAKCMKSSAQAFLPVFAKGLPEYGVERLEPFYMQHLDASSPTLKLILKDITGTGLENCIVRKMQFDQVKSKLSVKLECNVDFKGKYEMDGKVIILPIQGAGDAHVVLRKVIMSADVDVAEVTGKDGLPHWSVKRYAHSFELKDKASIELENLFNGNKELGRVAKELFDNSPNEVVNEVCPSIIAAIVDKIVSVCNKFFKKVPLKYLVQN